MANDDNPVRDSQTFAIIGAAMEVHTRLGCGFLEPVYRACLATEFRERGIPFRCEVSYTIRYKGELLPLRYRADLVCFESVIVEVKAIEGIGRAEQSQAINYMKVSGLHRALILNFGAPSLEYKRLVLTGRTPLQLAGHRRSSNPRTADDSNPRIPQNPGISKHP